MLVIVVIAALAATTAAQLNASNSTAPELGFGPRAGKQNATRPRAAAAQSPHFIEYVDTTISEPNGFALCKGVDRVPFEPMPETQLECGDFCASSADCHWFFTGGEGDFLQCGRANAAGSTACEPAHDTTFDYGSPTHLYGPQPSDDSLSAGEIVLISIGSVVAAGIVGVVAVTATRKTGCCKNLKAIDAGYAMY